MQTGGAPPAKSDATGLAPSRGRVPALRTRAPPVPPKIVAVLHEDWSALDRDADRMLAWIREAGVFHEFAHARDPFYIHLRGTWQILSCWEQPEAICRCGLLHSAYSRQGFNFRYFDITDTKGSGRDLVSSVLGAEAERLVFNYCSTWDPEAWHGAIANGEPLDPAGYDISRRIDRAEAMHISAADMARFLVGLVADVADQLTERFTYRDVYDHEEPTLLWPGPGCPGILYHLLSRMLCSSRPYLEVVPPVFNHCTEILDANNESEARDLYWRTLQKDVKLPLPEQEAAYRRVTKLNPYVAEPHVMLGQLLYQRGAFPDAVDAAATALDLFYKWGTCWDKRHPFAQWVGFTRMLVLRASRRGQGLPSLPSRGLTEAAKASGDPNVTYLQDLVQSFEQTTESPSERKESRL